MLAVLHTFQTKMMHAFPAMQTPDFRRFFWAKSVSDIGTWMQRVVQGYIVYELTGSVFWVGMIDALQAAPTLLFVLFGGVLLDRWPRKQVFRILQILQCVIAIIIGVLIFFNLETIWILALFAVLFGTANALDHPARMSLPAQLVERQYLRSAISLNSVVFNIARVIGPAFAGYAIALGDPGLAYILNGLSYLPLFFILPALHIPEEKEVQSGSMLSSMKEGLVYAYTNTRLYACLAQFGMFSVFGWAYASVLPVIAKDILQLDASGLGSLYTAVGAGAIVGGLWVGSAYVWGTSSVRILVGAVIFSVSLTAFALVPWYGVALVCLVMLGFGQLVQNASLQAQIQTLAPDEMRGRIASLHTFLTQGTRAFGGLFIGILASFVGTQLALIIFALVLAVNALWMYLKYLKPTQRVV